MPNRVYMQYENEDGQPIARWWGGEYIELGHLDASGDWHAEDVINVWDYAASKPTIAVTFGAFATQVEAHLVGDEIEP